MTKPVRFRLYPEADRGLHVTVYVWPTAKEMRARWDDKPGAGRSLQGFCSPLEIWDFSTGRKRTKPLFAEVHLWRGRLGMEVVSHEMFHATQAFGRRIKFDFSRLNAEDSINQDEERLAYAHGKLCRDFMVRAKNAGLYS